MSNDLYKTWNFYDLEDCWIGDRSTDA